MRTPLEVQQAAKNLVKGEVQVNQTTLVESLLECEFEDFTLDEVENLYLPFDVVETGTCRECGATEVAVNENILCRACFQPKKEIREWWAITRCLCEQLRWAGETVLDNDYGYWWGRTRSGDDIDMDNVIRDIVQH